MDTVRLLLGECVVEYDGRAASHLPAGERIIIVHENLVTVHSLDDTTVNPVNYMKDADVDVTSEDREMEVVARRDSPSEVLEITFNRVDKSIEYDGVDGASLVMYDTEDELQEQLHENPSVITFDFESYEREYDTGAGRVDLRGELTLSNKECLVEVKKTAGIDAISQLSRYLKADNTDTGIIASHNITDNALELLEEYDNITWYEV